MDVQGQGGDSRIGEDTVKTEHEMTDNPFRYTVPGTRWTCTNDWYGPYVLGRKRNCFVLVAVEPVCGDKIQGELNF